MSARRISAVACAALAVTFSSGSAALAYSTDSGTHWTGDETCTVRGTNGNDPMLKPPNPNMHNVICGFGGDDTIYAGNVGDTIYAGPGNDTIIGGPGGDIIEGQGGNDKIYGNGGVDNILGQTGDDTIDGGEGNDIIDGGNGKDKIDGGAGTDDCGPVDPNDLYRINCP